MEFVEKFRQEFLNKTRNEHMREFRKKLLNESCKELPLGNPVEFSGRNKGTSCVISEENIGGNLEKTAT